MTTDLMTPRTASRSADRRAAGGPQAGQASVPGTDARRHGRPVRRPRTDRPVSPVLPASPVRPVSPAGPVGPGRPGRTIRTGGPARQLHQGNRSASEQRAGTGARSSRYTARTPFVMLLVGLLGGGLVCLLVVNTTLAANSIEIIKLQQSNSAGTARVQQLEQTVGAEQSAAAIEAKARKLGMRTVGMPTYVVLRTGSLAGNGASGQPGKILGR
jgi:hypothetical protein